MKKCKVKNCQKKYCSKGYCVTHYYYWRRHGVPESEELKKWHEKQGKGFIDMYGYRKKWCNDRKRNIGEHRLIMEQHLGRKLKSEEHIHHINGDKIDNRIENLKIVDNSTHKLEHTREYKNGIKSCSRCKEVKNLNEFAFRLNSPKSRDRRRFYDSWCHTCKREVDNKYKKKIRTAI